MENKEIFKKEGKFIIFKHSPICNVSDDAKVEVDKYKKLEKHLQVITIDVIKEQEFKFAIADKYKVRHESPQILVIDNQKCISNFDHMEVTFEKLKKFH